MSATLEYAATHYPEMVNIPSAHYPPTTEEDMQKLDEISQELTQIAYQSFAGKKTSAPPKKLTKKTLSLDAGRMF